MGRKTKHIRSVIMLLVFFSSFLFQTAYSLTHKSNSIEASDYAHQKCIDKSAKKEEAGTGTYIEKETENDNESDAGLIALIPFHPSFQALCNSYENHHPDFKGSCSYLKNSIFISIRNLRI